jgi:hypothetical protein
MAPLAAAITRSPSHCQRDGHDFRPLLQILATYDLRFVEVLIAIVIKPRTPGRQQARDLARRIWLSKTVERAYALLSQIRAPFAALAVNHLIFRSACCDLTATCYSTGGSRPHTICNALRILPKANMLQ